MQEDPAAKIVRHRRTGLLVDTNLLLLYFIGNYDYATGYHLVNESRCTRGRYGSEDFEVLDALLKNFHTRITTPHILAEVSNLINTLPAGASQFCIELLRNTIPALQERNVSANDLVKDDEFLVFGVADMSIVKVVASNPCLTLTDDFKLSGYMRDNGMDALNFHEIKYSL